MFVAKVDKSSSTDKRVLLKYDTNLLVTDNTALRIQGWDINLVVRKEHTQLEVREQDGFALACGQDFIQMFDSATFSGTSMKLYLLDIN